uniref:Uncharacterized protein n=1 Tax=Meloidogyne enterolobii TaxID=390850 RepID=A0A6V7WF34_MELEN|nr:unnamed protein product [Meloidogyne enterolobii]
MFEFLLQNPPKPVQAWPPEPPPISVNFTRPNAWADKHFGQWCRNLTLDRHTQCPSGSPFHWYICCGETMTDCCFGIQTWLIIMSFSIFTVIFALLIFTFWLGPSPPPLQKLQIPSDGETPIILSTSG